MEQLVKSLTVDLASKKVGLDVQLTEDQRLLGILPPLVYIAGLVLCNKTGNPSTSPSISPPFSSALQDQFLELQKIYFTHTNYGNESESTCSKSRISTRAKNLDDHKNYHLSPRLVPSLQQRNFIHRDVVAKLKELEVQANIVANELLTNERGSKNTLLRKNKNSKKKALQKNIPIEHRSDSSKNEQDLQSDLKDGLNCSTVSSETLSDFLQIQNQRSEEGADADDSNSWVAVKQRGLKSGPKFEVDAQTPGVVELTELNDVGSIDHIGNASMIDQPKQREDKGDERGSNSTNGFMFTTTDQYLRSVQSNTSREEAYSNLNTSNLHGTTDITINELELGALNQRINNLEKLVAQKDEQLADERRLRTKSVREIKENFEDQIQALQMRLYISDTRLKNYQDALEQHVQTVANNVPGS